MVANALIKNIILLIGIYFTWVDRPHNKLKKVSSV